MKNKLEKKQARRLLEAIEAYEVSRSHLDKLMLELVGGYGITNSGYNATIGVDDVQDCRLGFKIPHTLTIDYRLYQLIKETVKDLKILKDE